MNIGTLIAIITALIGLLSLAKSSLNGQSKDNYNKILQNSVDELRKQLIDKDKVILSLTKDGEIKDAKIKAQTEAAVKAEQARLEALNLAQSRPAFEILGTQMVKQHKELLSVFSKQSNAGNRQMIRLTEEITKLAKTIVSKGEK